MDNRRGDQVHNGDQDRDRSDTPDDYGDSGDYGDPEVAGAALPGSRMASRAAGHRAARRRNNRGRRRAGKHHTRKLVIGTAIGLVLAGVAVEAGDLVLPEDSSPRSSGEAPSASTPNGSEEPLESPSHSPVGDPTTPTVDPGEPEQPSESSSPGAEESAAEESGAVSTKSPSPRPSRPDPTGTSTPPPPRDTPDPTPTTEPTDDDCFLFWCT